MLINFYDQVPHVYPNSSRDFQYLSWLINIVLNSVKHNVDDLYSLPNATADPRLTELLAMTLGFKVKRNYDQEQLIALVSIIPNLLKYKGTEKAVQMAGEALLKASGAAGSFICEIKNNELVAVLPEKLVDTTLFADLMPYILPAGMTCKIVRKTQIKIPAATEVYYRGELKASWQKDLTWDNNTKASTGLAELFRTPDGTDYISTPEFAFHKQSTDTELNVQGTGKLNIGLLDTKVIPTVEEPLLNKE